MSPPCHILDTGNHLLTCFAKLSTRGSSLQYDQKGAPRPPTSGKGTEFGGKIGVFVDCFLLTYSWRSMQDMCSAEKQECVGYWVRLIILQFKMLLRVLTKVSLVNDANYKKQCI